MAFCTSRKLVPRKAIFDCHACCHIQVSDGTFKRKCWYSLKSEHPSIENTSESCQMCITIEQWKGQIHIAKAKQIDFLGHLVISHGSLEKKRKYEKRK